MTQNLIIIGAGMASGRVIEHLVEDVVIHDAATNAPYVTYRVGGASKRVDADFVAGCDGFRGVSRSMWWLPKI